MLQTIITCDVCGIDERGPYPKETPGKYWKGEVAGGRWYKLSIYNEPSETTISEVTIDVCPECAEKLADQLGMDELPPLIEDEEEDNSGNSLTIVTNPVINPQPFSPPWDDDRTGKWDQYQWTWTNTSASSTTPPWSTEYLEHPNIS